MYIKPSKIIGWSFVAFFFSATFIPYLFDSPLRWRVKDFYDTYFLYFFVFAIAVWIADVWRDSYEQFKRNCLDYYYKGKWLNEEYENIYLNRNRNAFIWLLEKIVFCIVIVIGFLLMVYFGEFGFSFYNHIKTDYALLNAIIFMICTMIFLYTFYGACFAGGYALIKVCKGTVLKSDKINAIFKSYLRAEKFLSNDKLLSESKAMLIELKRKESEIYQLGLNEYTKKQAKPN